MSINLKTSSKITAIGADKVSKIIDLTFMRDSPRSSYLGILKRVSHQIVSNSSSDNLIGSKQTELQNHTN